MFPYLDDIFHAQASLSQVRPDMRCQSMISLLSGFYHKPEEVRPSAHPGITVFGRYDWPVSRIDVSSTSQSGRKKIAPAVKELLESTEVLAEAFMWVIGLMTLCHAVVPLCLFCLRPVSVYLADHYDSRFDSLTKLIPLESPVLRDDLEFWTDPSSLSWGVPVHHMLPTHILTTDEDVPEQGWGEVCRHHTTSGVKVQKQLSLYINYLEMLAVFLAIVSGVYCVASMS